MLHPAAPGTAGVAGVAGVRGLTAGLPLGLRRRCQCPAARAGQGLRVLREGEEGGKPKRRCLPPLAVFPSFRRLSADCPRCSVMSRPACFRLVPRTGRSQAQRPWPGELRSCRPADLGRDAPPRPDKDGPASRKGRQEWCMVNLSSTVSSSCRSTACRIGKGTHAASEAVTRMIRSACD